MPGIAKSLSLIDDMPGRVSEIWRWEVQVERLGTAYRATIRQPSFGVFRNGPIVEVEAKSPGEAHALALVELSKTFSVD